MSTNFSPPATVTDQDARDVSTVKIMRWGTVRETWDGRRFRYGSAGASDIAHGKMNVAAASVADHTNRPVAATVALAAKKVTATLGATAAAVSAYADGKLVTNDATGEGYSYDIVDHAAVLASGVITVKIDDPIKLALVTTTSEVSLVANPWFKAIVAPGAIAHRAIGVANVDIPAASTGFFQTRGDCVVLSDGVVSKGADAILSDATPGALEIAVDATIVKRVASAPEATVSTEYYTFNLSVE